MENNKSLEDLLWCGRAYVTVNSLCESNRVHPEKYQTFLDFRLAAARGFLHFLYRRSYA